ncbi:hypothetical protein DdX_21480 [Ditylenchus destructor]|uniref:Uncharacterized protein n=1 Tax=Ditylenchus destructor TaxID=166010 RepID=A0AAD4QV89_9BILA|nr:hypothetical protein DdX_21480 [Ditylenchus destructor]
MGGTTARRSHPHRTVDARRADRASGHLAKPGFTRGQAIFTAVLMLFAGLIFWIAGEAGLRFVSLYAPELIGLLASVEFTAAIDAVAVAIATAASVRLRSMTAWVKMRLPGQRSRARRTQRTRRPNLPANDADGPARRPRLRPPDLAQRPRAREVVGMADRYSERVGGIGACDLHPREQARHHRMDLCLLGSAGADHRLLDETRSISPTSSPARAAAAMATPRACASLSVDCGFELTNTSSTAAACGA